MKNITLKLFPILLSSIFIFPILKESLSSLVVILICINTILYKISAKDYAFLEPKTLLLTIPFWIILFRSFCSDNINGSLIHIQHALFFLVIPVFFSLIPKEFFTKQKINLYISVLKVTCLLIAVIYVFGFFINHSLSELFVVFQNVSSFRDYIYFDFKLFIIHPTYYTTLLVFCSAYSFDLVLKQKKYSEFIFIVCFLLISLLLLSRLNIVLLILSLLLMLFFRSGLKTKQMIGISMSFIALVTILAFFTPGIKERFVEIFESYNVKPKNVSYNSTNVRKAIFDCSVSISKENLLKGVGFENLQIKLNECYKSNYDSSFYEKNSYMTHNYFFYMLLSSGIIGLFFLITYFVYIFNLCFKSNLFLFKVFLLNVTAVCFIEDYLYRHYGILYFNLMLLCFIQYSKNVNAKNTELNIVF